MMTTKIISIAFAAIVAMIQVASFVLLHEISPKKQNIGRAILLAGMLISTVLMVSIYHWM